MKSDKGSKISLERGGQSALRIALVYIFVSAIWIITSDRLLLAIFRDPNQITSYQTIKGWVFIVLSGGLIFILARREYIGWMHSARALANVNRALRVLNACKHALVQFREEQALLSAICKVITEEGGYRMAWVGYVDDSRDGVVRPVAWQGFEDGYLEKKRVTQDEAETGRGPSGEALRTRRPVVVRNILLDPRFAPWREEALLRGYSSVISLPLEADNRVLGILSIYHRRVDVFEEDEVQLLVELAQDLAYGIAVIRSHKLRLEAEEGLSESRRRFQSLVENAPLGIAISSHGVFRYVNPAFAHMFGYQDDSQLVDHPVIELLVPEQRSEVSQRINLREHGQQVPVTHQLTGLRQDGSRFFLRSQICLLQWEGAPASLGFFTDITPIVESESLLKEREERYRTLFEQSPISLWEEDFSAIVDWVQAKRKEGVENLRNYLQENPNELIQCVSNVRVLDVNQATLQLYHAPSKEVLLEGIAVVSSGEGLANHIESILAVADGNSYFEKEVVNFTVDGKRLDVLLRWNTFPGHEEDFKRVIVSMQDITGLKRAISDLTHSQGRLKEAQAIARMGDWEYAPQSGEVNWSEQVFHLYQRDPALGEPSFNELLDYYHPDDRRSLEMAQQNALENAESTELDLRVWPGNGQEIIHHSVIMPVSDPSGKVIQLRGIVQDITERVQVEKSLRQQNRRLSALRQIDKAISTSMDLSVTLNVLLDQVLIELDVDAASIRLLNALTHNLDILAVQGFRVQSPGSIHLYNEPYAPVRAVLERQPQHFSRQQQTASGTFVTILDQEGFDEYYVTPLITKGKVQGVLEVYHRSTQEHAPDWHDFLELLAGEAAIAIENAKLFEKLQRSNLDLTRDYDATIETIVKAMELRKPGSLWHSPRLVDMTLRLARQIGFNDEQLVAIRRGTLLHDIGMLVVPDAVLFKPGPLEAVEWDLIRQHPQVAVNLVSPIRYLREALDIPSYHHERWDGSGYPRGLQGEQIPLVARIFCVVDVWDSLQTARPYRDAWTAEQAMDYLRQQAGVQFDPQVVDQFLHLLAEQIAEPS
jgi:PAS domain S-box-containing protein